MAHDVFISYSSVDKTAGETVCSILEHNGISCWMAPRDITPGLDFAEAIIDGIKSSKLFILLYTASSNNSKQVIREVDRAVHFGLQVINLRLEEVPMSKQLDYYLSSVHWLDAMTPPLEKHINRLSKVVKMLLSKDEVKDDEIEKAISVGTLRMGQDKKSIAVLPFINDSPDQENTYFINGVMEEILNNLQKIKDLRVISRTSVEQYREMKKPIKEIAQELGVNYIVEGSGQKYGSSFRLRTQLIMAEHESHLWGESFQQKITEVEDIFNIQTKIAETIAHELKAIITPEEKQLIEKTPTSNNEAYEAYLKGRFYCQNINQNNLDIAQKHFEIAIEKDPAYAYAYTGIAYVWLIRQQMGLAIPEEAGQKAMEAITKAAELDNNIAEVHYMQACINYLGVWDWNSSESEFQKALLINPNHAEAHGLYAHLLYIVGRPSEAVIHAELSFKLDPLNQLVKMWYGNNFLYEKRYEDLISICHEVLRIDPNYYQFYSAMGQAYHLKGNYEEALKATKIYYINLYPDIDHVFDQYPNLGYTGVMNLEGDLLAKQSEKKYVQPADIVPLYAMAGNKKKTLDWLEKGYEIRDPVTPYIGYPFFASLLINEPRYQELLSKLDISYYD
jgi:TolB-like protein